MQPSLLLFIKGTNNSGVHSAFCILFIDKMELIIFILWTLRKKSITVVIVQHIQLTLFANKCEHKTKQ